MLRRVSTSDAPKLFASYTTDIKVTRHLGWTPHADISVTESFLEKVAAEWDTGRGFPLVVSPCNEPDDLIGMFHPHVRGFVVNYGYVLAERSWGRGCASEVLSMLVEHALAHSAIYRAEAFCDVENGASARVMEKAGMTREGVLRRYFRHPNLSSEPQDCLLYARVR